MSGLFTESVQLLADGLRMPVERIEATEEVVLAEEDLTLVAGPVPAGTVAGQRWVWQATAAGTVGIKLEAIYRAHPSVAPQWAPSGWVTRLDGVPRITIELERWLANGLLGTAMHAVNAIEPVVAARPGVVTFLDLPLILGRWGAVR